MYQSLFFNKVAGLRTPFLHITSRRLLLDICNICNIDKSRAQMQTFQIGVRDLKFKINAKLKALLNLPLFRAIFKTLKQLLRGFIPVLISMLPGKPLLLIKSFSFVFRRGPQDVLRLLD